MIDDELLIELSIVMVGPVVKEKLAVAIPFDPLEKLLGNDLVGIDVGSVYVKHRPGDGADRFHRGSHSLTSTKWPVIADAAAIAGLTR
jgi:hypothetical protein